MTNFLEALFRTVIVAPLVVMMLAVVFALIMFIVCVGVFIALCGVALAIITGHEDFRITYDGDNKP